MTDDWAAASGHAQAAARQIAPRLREGFGQAAEIACKSAQAPDVVTAYDVEADARLGELLHCFDPGIGYWGEESGRTGSQETFWLVDPIDGTGHFLRGTPLCTTMIALIHEGAVVAAVIHDFVADATYAAHLGGGATCNGTPIQVSQRGLRQAYLGVEINLQLPGNLALMQQLQARTTLVSTINCGWEFAMIASGRLDGRFMKDPWGHPWDYAPGLAVGLRGGGPGGQPGRHHL